MITRKTKVKLQVTNVRPTVTYGCEVWTITKHTERNGGKYVD